MVNKKRIRLMTRLAIIEWHKKDELEKAGEYYRSEYIGIRMMKNAVRLTLAFGLGLLLWVCCNMDSIMKKLNILDIKGMVVGICAAYLLCMVSGLVITYIMATKQYFHGQKKLQQYHTMLERLEPEEKQN